MKGFKGMRKSVAGFLIVLFLCVLLSSCAFVANNTSDSKSSRNDTQEWMHTEYSKDHVREFMSVFDIPEGESLISGYQFDEDHCYNVTPTAVSLSSDVKIFKFSDSCLSFVLIDNEVYELCWSFGGFGFFNAVPWDYDADGTMDLLVASSWGSGMHRSVISVFNVKTKQETILYTSLATDDPYADWFVTMGSPSSYKFYEIPEKEPVSYVVYSAEVSLGSSLVDLHYLPKSCVGSIVLEDGTPAFHPYEPGGE